MSTQISSVSTMVDITNVSSEWFGNQLCKKRKEALNLEVSELDGTVVKAVIACDEDIANDEINEKKRRFEFGGIRDGTVVKAVIVCEEASA